MLNPKILEALQQKEFQDLTLIQKEAIPRILKGENLLIIAPTGSGKTESAVLPIFQKIIEEKDRKGIKLLYITPLRALNRDMISRFEWWAERLGFTLAVRHGDTTTTERKKQSRNPPEVLVTTPETLQILFLGKKLRKSLENVKWVVIDEVHELMDSERGAQLSVALERLKEITDFQVIGLSATIGNEREAAEFLGYDVSIVRVEMPRSIEVKVIWPDKNGDEELARILFVDEEVASKLQYINELVNKSTSTLIFVNTRQTAEALGLKLKRINPLIDVHHGSLSREARIEAEIKFTKGDLKALICTSSMELGMDIGDVDLVIQFNSPREVERLVQRVGRSGHSLGKVARGVIITGNFDETLESWAIVRLMETGMIEVKKPHNLSLDTLANQICAIALEYGRIKPEKIFKIVRRSYPFRSLTWEAFMDVLEFLTGIYVIRLDGDVIATRRTREYFYGNISMIPDENRKEVFDIVSKRYIGSLDESFLMEFSDEVFVTRGELWRIVEIDDVVKVEPVTQDGVIPSWIGEEIPVPFDVAQEVGRIRRRIASTILQEGREVAVKGLMKEFCTNIRACEEVTRIIEKQISEGFLVPDDRLITVEGGNKVIVVNVCFGHKVNEALGRILSMLLSARYGSTISMEIDPYRIRLFVPRKITPDTVVELMKSLRPEYLQTLLEKALKGSKLLAWKILHSGRKFGFFKKEMELINMEYLMERIADTPLYREAVREILHDKMDLDHLEWIVESLGKEISIHSSSRLSPIATQGTSGIMELIIPEKPSSAILNTLKRRLMEEEILLKCLHCNFSSKKKVKFIEEPIHCPMCNSRLIAAVNPRDREVLQNKALLFRLANLVLAYGKRAVITLCGYGVGAETASRILSKPIHDEIDLYREILKAERHYVKTRKFWD
jgi:ATP-dependent Lhr-like helicase